MIRINNLFDLIGYDGCKHVILSAVLTCLLGLVLPVVPTVAIVLGVGIGKEVYDKVSGKGCSERKDLVCDIIGILIGIL